MEHSEKRIVSVIVYSRDDARNAVGFAQLKSFDPVSVGPAGLDDGRTELGDYGDLIRHVGWMFCGVPGMSGVLQASGCLFGRFLWTT